VKDDFSAYRFMGVVALLALAPGLAWSYIDPGNGAYIVQTLFTLVAAGLFYLRHPLRSMRAVFRWLLRRKDPAAAESPAHGVDSKPNAALESAQASPETE
jgi:hypothetical protein